LILTEFEFIALRRTAALRQAQGAREDVNRANPGLAIHRGRRGHPPPQVNRGGCPPRLPQQGAQVADLAVEQPWAQGVGGYGQAAIVTTSSTTFLGKLRHQRSRLLALLLRGA
jgi:hypothetical protein